MEFLFATHGQRATPAERQHPHLRVVLRPILRSHQGRRDRLGVRQSVFWPALLRRISRHPGQLGFSGAALQRRGDRPGQGDGWSMIPREAIRPDTETTTDYRVKEEWTMQQEVAPIAVRPSTLSGLSERMVVSHYEDHYGNAVRTLNAVRRELAVLDPGTPTYRLRGLKHEELSLMGSVALHELYFGNLGGFR